MVYRARPSSDYSICLIFLGKQEEQEQEQEEQEQEDDPEVSKQNRA